jgi:V/A-type H+-transporting ATPase subunit D
MRLALNKNSLKQQRDQLTMYRRFLPSLDLKRQQLMSAWKESRVLLEQAEQAESQSRGWLEPLLPLLGSSTLKTRDLASLIRIRDVCIEEENVVGARLPVIRDIQFERTPYSTLTLPFWVDQLVDTLQQLGELRLRVMVARARSERLAVAVRKITQRVNLFEKVLIPSAQENIRRIQIVLSDEQRASVVRSKLAKRKHAKETQG